MNKLLSVLLILFAFESFSSRVVAYYPSWSSTTDVDKIQWEKLTDIYYSFGVPASNGTININNPSLLNYLKTQANSNGVNLHISLGGDGLSGAFSTIAANSSLRNTFAANIISLVNQYDFKGVDIDWEFPSGSEANNFKSMVTTINTALNNEDPSIELTIAVAAVQFNTSGILKSAVDQVDFINLMAYDDDRVTNHSTVAFAQESINFWHLTKGVSKDKMRLGVPFYGKNGISALAYKDISSSSPASVSQKDSHNGWQYNGQPTITTKANKVLTEGLNGIMIWDLSQDRDDQYSLLKSIDDVLAAGVSCENPNLGIKKSLCESPSIVLDPQVSGGTGFGYEWTKDGGSVIATSPTFTATASGNYCVTYTHTGNCPDKTSCVDVIDSDVIEVQDGSRCGEGEVFLEVLTKGSIKWFEQSTNGTQIASGQTYTTPVLTSDKTYYVEKPAVSEVVGKAFSSQGVSDAVTSQRNYLQFDALSDWTLDYVTVDVFPGSGSSLLFELYNSSGTKIENKSVPVATSGENRIAIGWNIATGNDYRIRCATTQAIQTEKGTFGVNIGFPFATSGVISFDGTYESNDDRVYDHWYVGFYDWEISSGGSCGGRTEINAIIESNCTPPEITNISPRNNQEYSSLESILLSADISDPDGSVVDDKVRFKVYEQGNANPLVELTPAVTNGTYTSDWTPTEYGSYVFEVYALDDDDNTNTEQTSFALKQGVGLSSSLEELGFTVFPNPSKEGFSLNLSNSSNVQVTVFNTQGGLVQEFNNVSGIVNLGEDFKSGVYIVQVNNGVRIATEKIIKQ